MSIFDMFKKVFAGSDDAFGERKTLEEVEKEKATDNTDIQKELEEKETKEFQAKFNWIEFYKDLLTKDSEIKDLIDELADIYNNPIDTQDLLNTLNIVVDAIIEKIPQGVLDEYNNISLLKSDLSTALIQAIRTSDKDNKYNVKSFIDSINPDLNNLYTFTTFLTNFIQIYRQSPTAMVSFIKELLVDPNEFLNDAFAIRKLYNYFANTPYSEITTENKLDFINKFNDFMEKYSDNNFIQRLNICVKDAKQQSRTQGKGHSGIIGGNL